MKRVASLARGVSVGVSLLLAGAAWAEGQKIGLVEMNRALQTVEAGKKAKSQLEKEIDNRKKGIQSEETALKKIKEDLEKQSMVMSDEARAKKGGEFQARAMKLQESAMRIQQELVQKEQELTRPIIQKIKAVIAELAKAKGVTMVIEKNENTILFSDPKDDFTDEVIKKFNEQNKG